MSSVAQSRTIGSFSNGLAVQARVIGALILRELHSRYGRENIGYLWLIGEPMLLATVIGIIHASNGHTAYGPDISPVAFGVLGYTVFILFRGCVNRSDGMLESSAPLLHHHQVTFLDVIFARAVVELAGVFTTFVILMSLIVAFGLAAPPARLLPLLGAWGLMLWYCLGQSMIVAAITLDNRTVGRLVHPYTYFMVALSGAFTPLPWMSHGIRAILSWVPMPSIFELARYGQFESYKLDYFYWQYLLSFCFGQVWLGLVLLRMARRHVHL